MNDFDFFVGSWKVANRRLRTWLAGDTEWDEFEGTSVCRLLLDGVGMVDEMAFPSKDVTGMTVGFHDQKTGEWSLYWVDGRDGILTEPVVGKVGGGDGEFFGETVHEGRTVRVRNSWAGESADAFRWEQAFSADGGETWELNWVMDFTRD